MASYSQRITGGDTKCWPRTLKKSPRRGTCPRRTFVSGRQGGRPMRGHAVYQAVACGSRRSSLLL
uniref:Uncharacterized protein n=1 Tax=Arundo donax TaxID=35708 RepID=A0A0A9CGC2_ARUDO